MITDYLMPGMNGAELIEHARPLARSMKVLLITGYSNVAEGPSHRSRVWPSRSGRRIWRKWSPTY